MCELMLYFSFSEIAEAFLQRTAKMQIPVPTNIYSKNLQLSPVTIKGKLCFKEDSQKPA